MNAVPPTASPATAPPPPAPLDGLPVWGTNATWQITLRWFVPPAIIAGVVLGHVLGFALPAVPILLVAAFIQTYNLICWVLLVQLRRPAADDGARPSSWPVVVQVVLDYIAMFVLIYCTGGAASPLLFIFLFHIIFAAILLDARLAWLFAFVAVGGMILLTTAETTGWLAPRPLMFRGVGGDLGAYPAHAWVTVFFFGVTVLVTAGTTTAVVARLRVENARAVRAREALVEERGRTLLQGAHNLRSPLSASISMLDVIMGEYVGPVTPAQRGYLDRVRRRLVRLNDTIGEMLTLASGRARAAERVRAPVDLAGLVKEVGAAFAEEATAGNLVLTLDAPDDVPPVPGDVVRLRQVVENLVSNAIKYTPPGGRVDVTVSRTDSRTVRLVVRDTGIGIPSTEHERLFAEFFRASNARDAGIDGTGLGLAVVKQTVDQHDGRIELESAEGRGTTVTVDLPSAAPGLPEPPV